MKRRNLLLWAALVVALILIELGIITRVLRFDLTNFYFVIVAIAVIGILAIIGAVFLGIFVTTRVFSSREFSPFEKEMLAMREDVKALTAKVEHLAEALARAPELKP